MAHCTGAKAAGPDESSRRIGRGKQHLDPLGNRERGTPTYASLHSQTAAGSLCCPLFPPAFSGQLRPSRECLGTHARPRETSCSARFRTRGSRGRPDPSESRPRADATLILAQEFHACVQMDGGSCLDLRGPFFSAPAG